MFFLHLLNLLNELLLVFAMESYSIIFAYLLFKCSIALPRQHCIGPLQSFYLMLDLNYGFILFLQSVQLDLLLG